MLIVLVTGGSRRNHGIVGIGAIADNNLLTVKGKAIRRLGGRGFNVRQLKAALAFHVSKCTQQAAVDDARNILMLLGFAAAFLQQSAKHQNGGKIRLYHKPFAQLFHHDHHVNGVATKATVLLGKGHRQPTELGECLPVLAIHTFI